MTTFAYLRQYERDVDRVLYWITQNGGSKLTALWILDSWAYLNKPFKDGTTLDKELLKQVLADQYKTLDETIQIHKQLTYRPPLWERIKAKFRNTNGS